MVSDSYDQLKTSLEILGVQKGDVILLKGDLTEIGMVGGSPRASLDLVFKVLWDAIGGEQEGTLITSAFTDSFFRWVKTDYVFDEKSPSKGGGAITKYFLQHPAHIRSKHPTNSFVAIGKHAKFLTDGHDETAGQYDPVGKVIELNGRALSLGTVADPPDFMTGHYAQQQAGLTSRTILKYVMQVKYRRGDKVETFKVRQAGGCTRGHYIVYAEYVRARKLRTAFFGKAYSISMLAADAFNISYQMQKKDPRAFICDDPNCFSCRGTWFWNWQSWPGYYFRNFFRGLKKLTAR